MVVASFEFLAIVKREVDIFERSLEVRISGFYIRESEEQSPEARRQASVFIVKIKGLANSVTQEIDRLSKLGKLKTKTDY